VERIIEIDIKNYEDLVEKYNDSVVSNDLIKYLLSQAEYVSNKENIKFVVDKHFETDINIEGLIKKTLKDKYLFSFKKSYINDILQIIFFVLGVLCLFFSIIIANEIIKEIVLIGGWILIWEMLDLLLFSDSKIKRDRRILKKLLRTKFEVK